MDRKETPRIPPPPAPRFTDRDQLCLLQKRREALTRIHPHDKKSVITFSEATCQRHFRTLKSLINTQDSPLTRLIQPFAAMGRLVFISILVYCI